MARGSIRWAYGTRQSQWTYGKRQCRVGLWHEAVFVVEMIPL